MNFERPKGLIGSVPRNWIDTNLSRCPFCKMPSLWELGEQFKLSFMSISRFHFRCPNCLSIVSIEEAVINPPVALSFTDMLINRKLTNKKLKVESVGKNQNMQQLVGQEYPLNVLQEWARQLKDAKQNEQ